MGENNLAVKVTADIVDLQTKFSIAQANVRGMTSELNKLATASAKGLIDPAGSARMQQLAGDLLHARNAASEFANKLTEAGVKVGGFGNRAKAETAGVGGAFETMSGTVNRALQFTGIGLAIEGIRKVAEAITEVGQRANDIRNMSEVLGVTGTQFQAMQIAAEETGIEANQLFRAMEKLVNVLHEARDKSGAAVEKLKELGITNEQINNKAFDAAQMMAYFSGRLNDASTAVSEQEAMLKVLGPRVALASRAFKEMGSDVAVWADKVREANGTTDEQNQRLSGIAAYWAHVGLQIENARSKLVIWSADALKGTELANMMQAGLGGHPDVSPNQGSVTGKIDRSQSEAQAKALTATQAGNAAITKDTLDSIRDQIEGTKQGSAERLALVRRFYQDSLAFFGDANIDKVKEAHRQLTAEERQYGEELKREAQKNAAELVTATRVKASAIMAEEGVSKAQQLAEVRDLYAEELQSAILTKEKRVEVERSLNESIAAVNREASSTRQAIARSDANTNIAIAKLSIEAEKQGLDERLQFNQITAQRKYEILKDLTQREYTLDLEQLASERSVLVAGTATYQENLNKRRELAAKLNLDLASLDRQRALDEAKQAREQATLWKTAVGEIENAESSMISDLLSGRKSFAASALSVASNLVTKEIENDVRAVTTRLLLDRGYETQKKALEEGGFLYHLIFGAKEVADHVKNEAAKTTATASAVTTRTAAQAAGDATGVAESLAAGLAQIQASAAVAAAGASASVAAIPFIGWAMAPEVAAATYAETLAYAGGLDRGAWEIPGTINATLHKGESVVPKDFASGLRASGALGGEGGQGAGGGNTYGDINNHFHQVMPTTDEIMAHFAKAVRNGHPAFRGMR